MSEEKREATSRVRIIIKDGNISVKTKNIFSYYETITILSTAISMLGTGKHAELDSYEWKYFDGSDPSICLAYNIETKELQISINDIAENMEIGLLEVSKDIVMKDILGS